MRKSLWIMLAVLAVAVSAPNAHADEFQYTYTVTASNPPGAWTFSWETVPIPGVTAEVVLPPSSLATVMLTGSQLTGCLVNMVFLDFNGTGDQQISFKNGVPVCSAPLAIADLFNLPLADYTTPGTYSFTGTNPNNFIQSATLEVSAVTTPEPSSVALMLLGVGLVFVLRKGNSRGQLAT